MNKTRLEAFSDGVIAILITIMVLELQVPHGDDLAALRPLLPIFLTYVLSFVMLGIYWNNHHHMLHADGAHHGRHPLGESAPAVLAVADSFRHRAGWARIIRAAMPTAVYGVVGARQRDRLHDPADQRSSRAEGPGSKLAAAVRGDVKGKASLVMYIAAVGLAFVNQWLSDALYVSVALMWLVPDPRIEKRLGTR